MEQLQPLNTPSTNVSEPGDNESSQLSREEARRKLKPLSTRPTQRTVFSGSRHTKALSLLSPKPSSSEQTPVDDESSPARPRRDTTAGPIRSSTTPQSAVSLDGGASVTNTSKSRQSIGGPPKDVILQTGRQLVGDFRDGLWTFFEDLRQVAAGEEIDTSSGNITRKPLNNAKAVSAFPVARPLQKDKLANRPFPTRGSSLHGKPETVQKSIVSRADRQSSGATGNEQFNLLSSSDLERQNTGPQKGSTDDDGWSIWDSPPRTTSPSRSCNTSNYTSDPMASPATERSSPRTSLRYVFSMTLEPSF